MWCERRAASFSYVSPQQQQFPNFLEPWQTLEPLNTISSFALILAGLMLLKNNHHQQQQTERSSEFYGRQSWAVVAIGIGSVLFHFHPCPLFRILDEGAIVYFFHNYLVYIRFLNNHGLTLWKLVSVLTLLCCPSCNCFVLVGGSLLAFFSRESELLQMEFSQLTRFLFCISLMSWFMDFFATCDDTTTITPHSVCHILIAMTTYLAVMDMSAQCAAEDERRQHLNYLRYKIAQKEKIDPCKNKVHTREMSSVQS